MKLASIEQIDELKEIEGADNIIIAKVQGWALSSASLSIAYRLSATSASALSSSKLEIAFAPILSRALEERSIAESAMGVSPVS